MAALALITGGQKGIGLGIARKLVAADFQVALASSSAPDAQSVREALAKLGSGARYYQHDLRATDNIAALLERVEAEQGPLRTLIVNAGVASPQRVDMLKLDRDAFDLVMDVNLKGSFFLAQAVARRWCDTDADIYRSIVFITSVSATMVSVERAEYCISKAAAAMMAQLYATRLAAEGIGVFDIRPGIIATDMTAAVTDKYDPIIKAGKVPARRWGRPDDIANAVLPLVQGQLTFANGAVLSVDGGLSIHRL